MVKSSDPPKEEQNTLDKKLQIMKATILPRKLIIYRQGKQE